MSGKSFVLDRRALLGGLAAMPFASGLARAQNSGELILRNIPGANRQAAIIGVGTARRYSDPAEGDIAGLRETIARFHELGGSLIDTAPSYGRAEEVTGRILEELGVRDGIFLATKVGAEGKDAGEAQIAESFAKLRTDYIDLIAVHNLRDLDTQLATLRALKDSGRIGAVGITTSFAPQHEEFEAVMRREQLDSIQVDYALDNRAAAERILPLAQDQGVAVMVNLPFGRDRLFDKTEGVPLPGWAAEIGCETWAQVFLKYVVSHPGVTHAIPGMARVAYVDDNMNAARAPLPDPAVRAEMERFIDEL